MTGPLTARQTATATKRRAGGLKYRRLLDSIRAALDDPRVSDPEWYRQNIVAGLVEARRAESEWLAARAAERNI
jgi:hypothetical protein